MEPRLGSRGKLIEASVDAEREIRFNGAATWKSRKVAEYKINRWEVAGLQWSRDLEVAESGQLHTQIISPVKASMEPRLGSRGKSSLRGP